MEEKSRRFLTNGVCLLDLADDLLGRMLLAFHREPPAAFHAALDSHNLWIRFWGADHLAIPSASKMSAAPWKIFPRYTQESGKYKLATRLIMS
jgi:hypothetical protein